MGKTITSLVASGLLFLTTAANVNAQAPFRNSMVPFNGKIEKMTKQDAKAQAKTLAKLKSEYPLLFKRKDLPAGSRYFADSHRMVMAHRPSVAKKSGALMANDQPSTLWINIVSSSDAGIYSATPAAVFSPQLLTSYTNGYFNGGCGVVDNKLYGVYFDTSYASWGIILTYLYSFDTDTWQIVDAPASVDYNLVAAETAEDPSTGEIFGEFYNNDFSGMEFGVIDYANKTRTTISSAQNVYAAMGIAKDGYAYGVASDGNLYKIDRNTGVETLVGATGLTLTDSEGAFYFQTGEIDPKTNTFYWSATTADGATALYTVDLTTGAATKLGDYSSDWTEFNSVGMMIPAPAAEAAAPAAVTDLAVNFVDGNTTGTVSFTAPAKTFDGTADLTGSLNYVVVVNSDSVKGTVAPGATATVNVTAKEGMNKFQAFTSNAAGNGPRVKTNKYVGYDTPAPVKDVNLAVDGYAATLTWAAADSTVHGGYLGATIYDVYRLHGTDTTKVASDLTTTTFHETLPEGALSSYTYGVVAKNVHHSSDMALSNGQVVGSALEVPYFEDFLTGAGLWTVIDNNNDGSTWIWNENAHVMRYHYSSSNNGDDWLISPPIKLQAGKNYSVTFKARPFGVSYPERIEAFWGKENSVAGLTETLVPSTDLSSEANITLGKEITPTESGEYYFGLHAISDADRFYLYVDSFNVEMSAEATAPDSVTALKAVCDPSGQLKATLTFNAPVNAINGNSLTKLDSIVVSRGNKVIDVMKDVAPGASYTVADLEAAQGTNKYTVTPYNENGIGRKREVSVYVGVDTPLAPDMEAEDRTTSVNLTWNTPAGAAGGIIIPEDLTYTLLNVDDEGYLADTLAVVKNANSYEVTGLNTNEGDTQNFKMWAISASNAAGASKYGSASVIVGRPYILPFHNSFKDATLENQFMSISRTTSDYKWSISSADAYDGDGGTLAFTSAVPATGYIGTGKISFAGAVHPRLLFHYKATGSLPVKLSVSVEHKDGTVDAPVYTTDLSTSTSTDWQTAVAELPATLADEDFVLLHFNAEATEAMASTDVLYVDDINIIDPEQKDASVTLTAPESVTKGQTAEINVKATNEGIDDITGARVLVTVNNTVVADTTISKKLATLESVELPLTYRTSTLDKASVLNVSASVTVDGDLVDDNNTASAAIEATAANVTEPSNLTAKRADKTVTLTWDAPASSATSVTDDFESYEPWSLTFGDWTTIDADQGLAGSLTKSGSYTHQGEQFAFMDWQPGDIFSAGQGLDPHSGQKALVAVYQTDATGQDFVGADNWLISPRLSGNEQTISFWANNLQGDGYGNETFQILTSTTGNAQADFTQLGTDYTQSAGAWTQYTATLPAGTTYFAIHHVTPGDQAFLFMLDDITYETSDAPIAYNVYRDGAYIATVASPSYVDTDDRAEHLYQVTAVYTGNVESAPISTTLVTSIEALEASGIKSFNVYTLDGVQVLKDASKLKGIKQGVYIINGVKTVLR